MAVDRRTIALPSSGTTGTATQATLMASNAGRSGFYIQNHATNPLFVFLGAGCTNLGTYHIILQGGTAVQDGKGGTYSQSGGSVYTGIISASGTAPTYTYLEY